MAPPGLCQGSPGPKGGETGDLPLGRFFFKSTYIYVFFTFNIILHSFQVYGVVVRPVIFNHFHLIAHTKLLQFCGTPKNIFFLPI